MEPADWGERGEPSIADVVHMIAGASNLGDATAFLHHLMKDFEGGAAGRGAKIAEFMAADGPKHVVDVVDEFGFPDEDGNVVEDDGIASYGCATIGCLVLYLSTHCATVAAAAQVAPYKQAAVDAEALDLLVELMAVWADNEEVLDAALHVVDSLTEGGADGAHARKLAALEAGLLPACLRVLQRHASALHVQEYGLGALARMVGLDETHRSNLLPDDEESVTALQPMASSHPRENAFHGGAVEIAEAALKASAREGGAQGLQVARQAVTLLANLAMGPDENARARKLAVQRAMPAVRRASGAEGNAVGNAEGNAVGGAEGNVEGGAEGGAQQHFSKGDIVRIVGVKSRPELNGRLASVLGLDRASGRYMVSVGHPSEAIEAIKLRAVNLLFAPAHLLNLPPEIIDCIGLQILRRDPPSVLRLHRTCTRAKELTDGMAQNAELRRLRWMDQPEPAGMAPIQRVFGDLHGHAPQPVRRWLGPLELQGKGRPTTFGVAAGNDGLAAGVTVSKDGRTVRQRTQDGDGWVAGPPLPTRGIIGWTVRLDVDDWKTASVGVSDESIGMSWALYLHGGSLRCLSRGPAGPDVMGHMLTLSPPPPGYPCGNGHAILFGPDGRPSPPPPVSRAALHRHVGGSKPTERTPADIALPRAVVEVIWDANGRQLYMRVNDGPLLGPRYADDASGPSHQPFVEGGFPKHARLRPWVGLKGAGDTATISPCWYEAGPALRAALRDFIGEAGRGARKLREREQAAPPPPVAVS